MTTLPPSSAKGASDTFVNAHTVPGFMPPAVKTSEDPVEPMSSGEFEAAPPSRGDLLRRAAELGPRFTWESFVIQPTDPVLGEKMQPRVAERRERFRKVVKIALASCVGCCLLAAIIGAVSDPSSTAPAAGSLKTAPAAGVTLIEPLQLAARSKASSTHSTFSAPTFSVAAAHVPTKTARSSHR